MRLFDESLLGRTLDYIKEYQLREGKSPSYRNIMCNVSGYGNLTKVQRYIAVLHNRGLINKESSVGITIPKKLMAGKTDIVSLVGEVACGTPILAVENIEGSYLLPVSLFGEGEKFLLRAKGDSMVNKGIENGDLLVVHRQSCADNGQIVVALIDDVATVKTFEKRSNRIVLHPENDEIDDNGNRAYQDIDVSTCQILGIVTNSIKEY